MTESVIDQIAIWNEMEKGNIQKIEFTFKEEKGKYIGEMSIYQSGKKILVGQYIQKGKLEDDFEL